MTLRKNVAAEYCAGLFSSVVSKKSFFEEINAESCCPGKHTHLATTDSAIIIIAFGRRPNLTIEAWTIREIT